jgi:hypothetical protein
MKHGNLSSGGSILTIFLASAFSLAYPLQAQQDEQAPPAPSQSPDSGNSTSSPGTPTSQPTQTPQTPRNDRIFWALPNYLTVENATKLPPLTTEQKFKTVAQGCFDPIEFMFIGVQAGIDQADDVNPTYRQGMAGYSRRFGTAYADAIIGNFGTGAIFPTLLRQDPRYYQMGKGSFLRRFGYAAMRVGITRSDSSGKHQFNFSEIFGNGLAAGLSNTYHPGPHTIVGSANVLGTQTLLDALGYELKEFWPDLHHFLERAKHKM